MSRISSQGTTILISDPAVARTTVGIASATKAKPCVMTLVAGSAPVVGDLILIRNTGWQSLDDRIVKVKTVAAQVITLEDTDTSKEALPIKVSTDTPPAQIEKFGATGFVELCRSNWTLAAPAGATIDVTTLCDEAHRLVPGLPAISTWTAPGFYDSNDTAITIAREAGVTGATLYFDVRFRDGSGVAYAGTINTFDVAAGVNAAVTNNMGGNVDGRVSWYKTPAAGFVPFVMPENAAGIPESNMPPPMPSPENRVGV